MFEIIKNLFYFLFFQPLFNILIIFYNFSKDFGLSILILTIFVRMLLYPLSLKVIRSQKKLLELQPQIQEIQKKYKDDKSKQGILLFELYKKEKINPFSSIFLSLIQLPILFALYKVVVLGFQPEELSSLYSFIPHPERINVFFIGILDLSKPNYFLAFLAGITQYFQIKSFSFKKYKKSEKNEEDFSQMMQKQMLYFFPFVAIIILLKLPAALAFYWTTNNIFSIGQQYFIFKKLEKNER